MTVSPEGLCGGVVHGGFPAGTREVRGFQGDPRDVATGGGRDKKRDGQEAESGSARLRKWHPLPLLEWLTVPLSLLVRLWD